MKTGRVTVGVVGVLGACAGPPTPSPDPGCAPATYTLDGGARADRVVGTFDLTLVAATGDSAGGTVAGALRLMDSPREDAALIGSADVGLAAVGALEIGSLASADADAPGVLVMENPGDRPTILLRFGSSANAAGVVRFDGGYTVLEVQRMDSAGFAGTWRSGIESNTATGHFCAVRRSTP